jgi:hypothetical protein
MMKSIAKNNTKVASLTIATLFMLTALAMSADAAPTVRPFSGKTSVELSDDFLGALGALSIAPGTIRPGMLRGTVASFRINGGGIDLGTLMGEISHVGGLTLTNENGTTVGLFNFTVSLTDSVLTGLVTVNGDLVGRIPLFNLEPTADPKVKGILLRLSDVLVTLTMDAADALNAVFDLTAFEEGFDIGVANVKALTRYRQLN